MALSPLFTPHSRATLTLGLCLVLAPHPTHTCTGREGEEPAPPVPGRTGQSSSSDSLPSWLSCIPAPTAARARECSFTSLDTVQPRALGISSSSPQPLLFSSMYFTALNAPHFQDIMSIRIPSPHTRHTMRLLRGALELPGQEMGPQTVSTSPRSEPLLLRVRVRHLSEDVSRPLLGPRDLPAVPGAGLLAVRPGSHVMTRGDM